MPERAWGVLCSDESTRSESSGGSLDALFFAEAASVLPDHAYFLTSETRVFDRHTEECIFVLLVVGSEGVLVKQHQFMSSAQAFAKSGRFFLIVAIRLDSRCMRWSSVAIPKE